MRHGLWVQNWLAWIVLREPCNGISRGRRMIRILFIIDKLAPAGTQTNLLEIIRRLDRIRFTPYLVALSEGGELANEFERAGCKPVILNVKKAYGFSGWNAVRYLVKLIRTEKIDLIQTHFLKAELLGLAAAKLTSIKTIYTTRRDEGFWRSARQLQINRILNRYFAGILVNSEAVRRAVMRDEQVSPEKIHLIYNGIDTAKFFESAETRKTIRKKFGFAESDVIVGVIANMRHVVKGHSYLIEAVPQILRHRPDTKFLLIGDGDLKSNLEDLARKLEVRHAVLFGGSRRDTNALINAFDIACLPSLSEGFSNSLVEYMAVRKPVVATAAGGNPESCRDEVTGLLVPASNSDALAAAILRLIENESLRRSMGESGRKEVMDRFTVEKMAGEYMKFYETAVGESKTNNYDGLLFPRRRESMNSNGSPTKAHARLMREYSSGRTGRSSPKVLGDDSNRVSSRDSSFDIRNSPRLVRVLHIIWSLDLGGAEQVVVDLVRNLDRKIYTPVVCCLNDKGRYAPLVEKEGIKVIAMNKAPKFDLFLILQLVRLIRREEIDLIHTHLFTSNLWGRIAAWIAGVPAVSTEHGMDVWRPALYLKLDSILTPVSRRMIFVSEGVRKFYSEKNPSLNGRGRVVYNGINIGLFADHATTPKKAKHALGLPADAKVVGIVGRLVPEKAHEDFIDAIRILSQEDPSIIGLVIGEGECEKALHKKVYDLGIEKNIHFAGYRNNLQDLYPAMDVFVMSSLREGLPLTMLEAMAAGVPVVATEVGGIPECIRDKQSGLLIPPRNPRALAEAIRKILNDDGLRQTLIAGAKADVTARFSIERMVKDHEAVYQDVMNMSREGAVK